MLQKARAERVFKLPTCFNRRVDDLGEFAQLPGFMSG
jgi:hypothetical protein